MEVRLTDQEHDLLTLAAVREGMTLSEFVSLSVFTNPAPGNRPANRARGPVRRSDHPPRTITVPASVLPPDLRPGYQPADSWATADPSEPANRRGRARQ